MKYYLYLWITGCIGLECPIEDVDVQAFDTLEGCNNALELVIKTVKKKKYAGICLPADRHESIQRVWDDSLPGAGLSPK